MTEPSEIEETTPDLLASDASAASTAPLSFDDIMSMKTAMEKSIQVQLNGKLMQEIIDLKDRIQQARVEDRTSERMDKPLQVPKLKAELETLLERAKNSEVEFVFQSIGRPAYERLLFENRPTQQQQKEGYQYNPDKFCPALVAAACVQPKMTLEQAKKMYADPNWNNAELVRIFLAANEVNTELPDIPLSNSVIAQIIDSASKLTTASNEGSPTPSI